MTPREETPLLAPATATTTTDHDETNQSNQEEKGDASVMQTMTNMAKACMGPGCLTLPFAAHQGGMLLHTVGLLAMALWNVYIIQRLCQCLDYLPPKPSPSSSSSLSPKPTSPRPPLYKSNDAILHPPEGTAMFGQVMWYATGSKGLWALDFLMLSFLLGILITYINAMRSFLRLTPLTTHSDVLDALLLVAIMGPLAAVPHMGYLSKASAMGLVVLALSFVVLGGYGWEQLEQQQQQQSTLSWYPQQGLWGISQWFGCVVFSFGVAPLTYNFRSSMEDPTQMVPTASYTLLAVAVANMLVGIGFWIMFPAIDGDLLQELPADGILPSITRLAMVLVVLTTTPLLIVPCGELLEGKAAELVSGFSVQTCRIVFRIGISLIGVAVSLYVPGFVDVLSFVGCCCVAMLAFTIPPFLHGILYYQAIQRQQLQDDCDLCFGSQCVEDSAVYTENGSKGRQQKSHPRLSSNWWIIALDILMFTWGLFATIVSTTFTFQHLSPAGPKNS